MNRRDMAAWIFLFALFFVTKGDPDLWDLAHKKAVAYMAK